jgi:hypothetical protein
MSLLAQEASRRAAGAGAADEAAAPSLVVWGVAMWNAFYSI